MFGDSSTTAVAGRYCTSKFHGPPVSCMIGWVWALILGLGCMQGAVAKTAAAMSVDRFVLISPIAYSMDLPFSFLV